MKKILIVDDDAQVSTLLGYKFVQAGYQVISAVSGTDGLKKIYEEKPDLIVLDICMPDLEGTEVAQTLKKDPKTRNIPIIFLTALMTKEDEATFEQGITKNVIFAKPIESNKILDKVREFLET